MEEKRVEIFFPLDWISRREIREICGKFPLEPFFIRAFWHHNKINLKSMLSTQTHPLLGGKISRPNLPF